MLFLVPRVVTCLEFESRIGVLVRPWYAIAKHCLRHVRQGIEVENVSGVSPGSAFH